MAKAKKSGSSASVTGLRRRRRTSSTASAPDARLTTDHGTPLSDNQNSLRAGRRGPSLLEDCIHREKSSIST